MIKTGILFLCICLPVTLCAQQKTKYSKRTAEEKARYYTKAMIDSLSLDSIQEEAVYAVNLEVSKRFNLLFEDTTIRGDKRKPHYRAIYQYRDKALKACLSRKQYLRFLDIEMDRRERKKKKFD